MRFHNGKEIIGKWAGDELAEYTHVVRLIHEAFAILVFVGVPSILLLDSYFLSVPALTALNMLEQKYGNLLTIVTKAKSSYVALKNLPLKQLSVAGRP